MTRTAHKPRRATYGDAIDAAPNHVAQIVDGTLHSHPPSPIPSRHRD